MPEIILFGYAGLLVLLALYVLAYDPRRSDYGENNDQ